MKERFSKIVHKRTSTHRHEEGQKYSHTDDHSVVSRLWQKTTVVGTLAVGLAEIATGRSSSAVLIDGIHNVVDSGTLGFQAENALNKNISPERQRKRRKIVHTVIAGTSAAVAVKAGIELGLGSEITQNPVSIYTAGASLALNTALGAPLIRNYWRKRRAGTADHHDRDLVKHMLLMDVPSAALAFGSELVRQKYGIAEPISAIASGMFGSVIFRPTQHNLDHDHHEHTHEDHEDHDVIQQKDGHPHKKRRVLQRIVAATTAATVLGGGIFLGVKGNSSPSSESRSPSASASISGHKDNHHEPSLPNVSINHKKLAPIHQQGKIIIPEIKKKVHAGDTVWGMEKEILHNAGCSGTATEIANDLPSIQKVNDFDINRIYPNETVIFPSQLCQIA